MMALNTVRKMEVKVITTLSLRTRTNVPFVLMNGHQPLYLGTYPRAPKHRWLQKTNSETNLDRLPDLGNMVANNLIRREISDSRVNQPSSIQVLINYPSGHVQGPTHKNTSEPIIGHPKRRDTAKVRKEASKVILGGNYRVYLHRQGYRMKLIRSCVSDKKTKRMQYWPATSTVAYKMPSDPTYLLYNLQHTILTSTQRALEECCFYFSRKWLPPFLEE